MGKTQTILFNVNFMKNIKKGMIIRFKDETYSRCWMVLPVTKKDLKRGINADKEGLYAFGGMWYGRNPMKHRCYGKILDIENSNIEIIHENIIGLSVDQIKSLVN